MRSLIEITDAGEMRLNFHPGQAQAWQSERRFVAVIAGVQSGKTSFGPLWLLREIQRTGPGDYMIVTPNYPLLQKKALPEFLRLFRRRFLRTQGKIPQPMGHYSKVNSTFEMADGSMIFFGHATDPESLESATAKAVWLDECGQSKFKLEAWEAIQRRLSLYQGRALMTTSPYGLNWLKQQVYDRWAAGDVNYDVIRFESTMNPVFPPEEMERARRTLPAWKFDLFYRATFTRPAGLIYDAFDERTHKVPRFKLPDAWQRYLGLDFGGVNTAGVFYAEEPNTKRLYAYREYKAGGRTSAEHAEALLQGEPMVPICVGGSKSEEQWRNEFRAAGLPVQEPAVSGPDSVEIGIQRVYECHKEGRLFVFADLAGYLEEKLTYSRELGPDGEPTEKIENKETYHRMDAERYVISWLKGGVTAFEAPRDPGAQSLILQAPSGVFLPEPERERGELEEDGLRFPW